MDQSKKHEPHLTFQAANLSMETHPIPRAGHAVSELLEDSGNIRQIINQELSLHLLSDSLFSEQQKLRHVLDWAHTFLSRGSEVHHEFCRADGLILADDEQRKTHSNSPACKHSPAGEYHHPVSCTAGGNGVFCMEKVWQIEPSNYENSESKNHLCAYKPPFLDDPCTPFSLIPGRGEVARAEHTETPENMTSMELQDSGFYKGSYKTAGAQSERDTSGHLTKLSKVGVEEGKVGGRKEVGTEKSEDVFARNSISNNEPKRTQEQVGKSCHLKIPPTMTVYEQYQLCVDQLHHLRVRQSQHIEGRCFTESPARERKTSEEIAAIVETPATSTTSTTNPEIKKRLNKVRSKRITDAEITKERSSDVLHKSRNRATLTEHGQSKPCDNFTVKETPIGQRNMVTSSTHLDLNRCGEVVKGTAGGITSLDKVINMSMEHLGTAPGDNVPAVEERAALTTNPGLFSKRIGHNLGMKRCWSRVSDQKKKVSLRRCEKSSVSPSSPTKKEILQRPQSSGVIKHTKRHTPEDKVKPTSAYRDTHKCLPATKTHTPLHVDPGPKTPASSACRCEQTDSKYNPADVPVCDRWLCLPDEVWLSILSLLPHSDLCRVVQVCSRLHTLATDHTLWKDLRIENSNLTERWLLCVGRRRPRSFCLYSCSGLSLTSWWLEVFFTLCRNFLEELKVTSCTGPGLHGDQMLPLIGQLCHHVTSVDVSWSGATDTGVKALSDCCSGLQLKSVVLNGCHVTDNPLMKLVIRHKESLCRLEVFGCQFITPSCLQRVYETCPGLQHLNIGQVPKVNAHSLAVMTSQLKCLISLNLTGLQAVSDTTVDTLLQNCVELQSLIFSSCPGVSDLTLHSISKYTPCIRSLDVSGCKAVTDAGVRSLALGCRRLQQLDLSSTGTGNRGVTLLANYCSGHLHTVKLSFCYITSENIVKLCKRCKRLKVLHLYGCAHLPTQREIREANAAVKVYPLP